MNTELARETFDAILSHRDRWYQGSWGRGPMPDQADLLQFDYQGWAIQAKPVETNHCGTAMCFAGWAVAIAHPKSKLLVDPTGLAEHIMFADGTIHDIRETAKEDLGISYNEASDLFSGDNLLEDLIRELRSLGVETRDILLEHDALEAVEQ